MNWGLYYLLLSVYGNVDFFLTLLLISASFSVGLFFVLFILSIGDDRKYMTKIYSKYRKYLIWPIVILVVLNTLLPSRKDLMIATALYVSQKPVEQVLIDAGSMYPKLKKLLKKELDELLDDEVKEDK